MDSHRHPNFELTKDIVERFIRFESHGEDSLSREERISINAMVGESRKYATATVIEEFGAKGIYELTKKMVHEETFAWWASGWGWYYPLAAHINGLFRERHKYGTIAVKEYLEIFKKMRRGPIEYLVSLEGSIFSRAGINEILQKKI